MKPAPFVHHAPRSLDEALAVLHEVGHDGKVLAGGQSLIPILNMRLASPAHLVDINRVEGLDTVEAGPAAVRVGATVRHAQLERHHSAYAALPLLRQALRNVAHPAIRNRGTTVGSIAHADAAGEMPAILALTDGVVEARSTRGSRDITAEDFFQGALETALAEDEVAVAVRFGTFPTGTGTAFAETARRHGDYALAGVAAAVTVDDGHISRARASFVSVTDVPTVLDLTDLLAGTDPSSVDWSESVAAVRDHIEPEADIHASADYRRMLAGELAQRVLRQALHRALGGLHDGSHAGSHDGAHSPTSTDAQPNIPTPGGSPA